MNSEFEDELEFFGFLPSEFHLELYQMLGSILGAAVVDSAPGARGRIDALDSAIEKNMLIFERFTLRNIFTFPDGFVYDRRATAEAVPAPEQLKGQLLSLALQRETLASLKESVHQQTLAARELQAQLQQLTAIPSLDQITSELADLNLLVKQARELKKKYLVGMPQPKVLKKELEEEIRSKECADLEKRIPLAILGKLEQLLASGE